MRTGQARKRDYNEREIVDVLRALGVTVIPVSGEGAPDLLCWHWREGWVPIEVKHARGQLTAAQTKLRAQAPYPVVRSVAEGLALFGVTA